MEQDGGAQGHRPLVWCPTAASGSSCNVVEVAAPAPGARRKSSGDRDGSIRRSSQPWRGSTLIIVPGAGADRSDRSAQAPGAPARVPTRPGVTERAFDTGATSPLRAEDLVVDQNPTGLVLLQRQHRRVAGGAVPGFRARTAWEQRRFAVAAMGTARAWSVARSPVSTPTSRPRSPWSTPTSGRIDYYDAEVAARPARRRPGHLRYTPEGLEKMDRGAACRHRRRRRPWTTRTPTLVAARLRCRR